MCTFGRSTHAISAMRIAFLFSVENGVLYDEEWTQWLRYTPSHLYFVAVHAREPTLLREGSFAHSNLSDLCLTGAGAEGSEEFAKMRDNYDVQRLLLRKAIDAPGDDVTLFVMCDSDSVPVKSFESLYAYLAHNTKGGEFSMIQFCPHRISTEAGRKILHMALVKYVHALRSHPKFASQVSLSHWYWGSKFAIFTRDHATALVADEQVCGLFPQYGITNVANHYPMQVLSAAFPDGIVNCPTTFEAWNADGSVRIFAQPETAAEKQR
jgi:hypothetical protein